MAKKSETGEAIAKALRYLREDKGYSQNEVAKALNKTQVSVSQWESGVRRPGYESIRMLASIYECQIDDIIPKPATLPKSRKGETLEERVRRVTESIKRHYDEEGA